MMVSVEVSCKITLSPKVTALIRKCAVIVLSKYSIYLIKHCSVYLIFFDLSAAFIRGWCLYEGGVYKSNLFLANNSMVRVLKEH